MLYACAARFDVTKNLKKFLVLRGTKQDLRFMYAQVARPHIYINYGVVFNLSLGEFGPSNPGSATAYKSYSKIDISLALTVRGVLIVTLNLQTRTAIKKKNRSSRSTLHACILVAVHVDQLQ